MTVEERMTLLEVRMQMLDDQNAVHNRMIDRLAATQQAFHDDVWAWVKLTQLLVAENDTHIKILEAHFKHWLRLQEGNGSAPKA